MNLRRSTLFHTQVLFLATTLGAGVDLADDKGPELPKMTETLTFTVPASLGFLTDLEILPEGRIIVTDSHLTAIL